MKVTKSRRDNGPSEISKVEFQSLLSLHSSPIGSGSRLLSYASIDHGSSITSFESTKDVITKISRLGAMTTGERKSLATRITTSIMAQNKESQSGPMPHSGLRVHLAPDEQKPDEEGKQDTD